MEITQEEIDDLCFEGESITFGVYGDKVYLECVCGEEKEMAGDFGLHEIIYILNKFKKNHTKCISEEEIKECEEHYNELLASGGEWRY